MLDKFVAVDLETTGLSPSRDSIIEIGAIKVLNGKVADKFETFINPGRKIPQRAVQVTGITDDMVENAPYIENVIESITGFSDGYTLLGHNLIFDYSFLKHAAVNKNLDFERTGIDTLKIARKYLTDLEHKNLDFLCHYFGIKDENHHRAVNDAQVTIELYKILCKQFENDNEPVFKQSALVYRPKKQVPATPRQISFLNDLIIKNNLKVDYDVKRLSKSQASRQIDIILSTPGNKR